MDRTLRHLRRPEGIALGLLLGAVTLSDPLQVFSKQFWGGATAHVHSKRLSRLFPFSCMLVLCVALTLVIGPSSAIAMIPRLDWWKVSQEKAFGAEYVDRVYFNRTDEELWPQTIDNSIFADLSNCGYTSNQDCAIRAIDIVSNWMRNHQSQGTKPNITINQDLEVSRYLTSQGGPPDSSSWTVSSTIPYAFARDLSHYWAWLAENSSLPSRIDRPLFRPRFINSTMKFKKPLVQAQCRTYHNPQWQTDIFEFPHDELLTPPLDKFKLNRWILPNDFVTILRSDGIQHSKNNTIQRPFLFRWFDAASNFHHQGAPSLGAVLVAKTWDGSAFQEGLSTCAFDGRWAPVELYLNPREAGTVFQDSPNPLDILNGSAKVPSEDLIRLNMSINWAHTLNVPVENDGEGLVESAVEGSLRLFSDAGNRIFPEPEPTIVWIANSTNWRLSTTLGMLLTEGLARAFQDSSKGSMLYRQARDARQSYVRLLNDINFPGKKEGYRNGTLDWVERRDGRWNASILPWTEWAPQNGYRELGFTIYRNGYGYGFQGVPIKLAAIALFAYVVFIAGHLISMTMNGKRLNKAFTDIGEMFTLAWHSEAPPEHSNGAHAGTENVRMWRQPVKMVEKEDRVQLVLRGDVQQVT
ncbi:MAG: hypothetical protein Q9222_003482 [Ikaeria aurantiellina]